MKALQNASYAMSYYSSVILFIAASTAEGLVLLSNPQYGLKELAIISGDAFSVFA